MNEIINKPVKQCSQTPRINRRGLGSGMDWLLNSVARPHCSFSKSSVQPGDHTLPDGETGLRNTRVCWKNRLLPWEPTRTASCDDHSLHVSRQVSPRSAARPLPERFVPARLSTIQRRSQAFLLFKGLEACA